MHSLYAYLVTRRRSNGTPLSKIRLNTQVPLLVLRYVWKKNIFHSLLRTLMWEPGYYVCLDKFLGNQTKLWGPVMSPSQEDNGLICRAYLAHFYHRFNGTCFVHLLNSTAISQPEFPVPTTTTFWSWYLVASRYELLCKNAPWNFSRPVEILLNVQY